MACFAKIEDPRQMKWEEASSKASAMASKGIMSPHREGIEKYSITMC